MSLTDTPTAAVEPTAGTNTAEVPASGVRPSVLRLVRRRRTLCTQHDSELRRAAEAGMTTAEYAIGTIAACTFAAVLIAIARSPEIRSSLIGVITRALGLGA